MRFAALQQVQGNGRSCSAEEDQVFGAGAGKGLGAAR
jgi:hypothetical protein